MEETKETTTEETKEPVQTEMQVDDPLELVAKEKKEKLELARKLQELEAKFDKQAKETLKKQSSYKELAEQYEKELEVERGKNQRFSEAYLQDRKLDAVKAAASQAGIRKDAIDDLELLIARADIEVETTSSGRINILGADKFVARLKSQKPYLFETKGSKVNPETPGVGTASDMSWEKLEELKAKASKSSNPKSREWQEYKQALLAFSQQN